MKFKKILSALIFFLLLIIISGCDKGIEPADETAPGETGFSGKVTFTGSWPAGVKRTHIVVFKNEIISSQDFFPPNLAFVIDSIPYRSTEFNFNSVDNNFIPLFVLSPGEYKYIVVAQSSTPEISLERKDWSIVGVYCLNGIQSNPKPLIIESGKMTRGVDINVNFGNPPPQPPI
jgi:hypothetical protein